MFKKTNIKFDQLDSLNNLAKKDEELREKNNKQLREQLKTCKTNTKKGRAERWELLAKM